MADDEGHWLDIQVHKRTHDALKRWGRRAGVTPEGYAKMLLTYAMHPLLAAEAAAYVHVPHETKVAQPPYDPDRDLALWRQMFEVLGGSTGDDVPAPREVNGTTRIYHADDFNWPEGAVPTRPWFHIGGDGSCGVGGEP